MTELSFNKDELVLFAKKLASIRESLSENETKILDLILLKASEIKPEQISDPSLLTSSEESRLEIDKLTDSELQTLNRLAKAIDGVSDTSAPEWLYTFWSYKF